MPEAPQPVTSHAISGQTLPKPSPKLDRPATRILPRNEYGPVALGFLFPFEELMKRGVERSARFRELSEQDPQPTLLLATRLYHIASLLCVDLEEVWPEAYVCYVKDPKTKDIAYAVALTDNTHPEKSKVPTVAEIYKIREILQWQGKATWYDDMTDK